MWNRVWPLTKIIFSQSFNVNLKKKKYGDGKRKSTNLKRNKIVSFLLIAFIMLMVGGSFALVIYPFVAASLDAGTLNELGSLLSLIVTVLILVFSGALVFTTFFTSNDNHVWLPLPLKANDIYLARLISCLLNIYLILGILIIPTLVVYIIAASLPIQNIIGLILYLISVPLLPVALIFIIAIGISYIINIQKHRNVFNSIVMILNFVVIIALSFSTSFISAGESGEIVDPTLLVQSINSLFVSSKPFEFVYFFSAPAFYDRGLISLIFPFIFLLISISGVALSSLIATKSYGRTLYGQSVTKKKTGKKIKDDWAYKEKNTYSMLVKREANMLFRSPTFMFQLLFPQIIVLLTLGFVTIVGFVANNDTGSSFDILKGMVNFENGYIFVIVLTISAFLNSTNLISSTAFSREGGNAALLKSYPLKVCRLIHAKITLGVIFDFLTVAVILLPLGIIAKINLLYIVICLLGVLVLSILMNYLSILFDTLFPTTNWVKEIEVARNNKNLLFSYFASFLISILLGLSILIFYSLKINIIITSIVIFVLLIALIILFEILVKKHDIKILKRLV